MSDRTPSRKSDRASKPPAVQGGDRSLKPPGGADEPHAAPGGAVGQGGAPGQGDDGRREGGMIGEG